MISTVWFDWFARTVRLLGGWYAVVKYQVSAGLLQGGTRLSIYPAPPQSLTNPYGCPNIVTNVEAPSPALCVRI